MGTFENFVKDDPLTTAVYAKDYDLLDTNDWISLKKYARIAKNLHKKLKQMKDKSRTFGSVYKYGVQVPNVGRDAHWLQDIAGHTKWTNAEDLEISQVLEYEIFNNLWKHASPP